MIGNVIKAIRLEAKLSQDALADAITDELSGRTLPPTFVTKQAISLMETGKMKPNALMFEWLAYNSKSCMVKKLARRVLSELSEFHGEGIA